MKVTAVRLINNRDPVGIFGGWLSDFSFDADTTDECTDPSACEYFEFEIDKLDFGIIWPKAGLEGEDFSEEVNFIESFSAKIFDTFESPSGWKQIYSESVYFDKATYAANIIYLHNQIDACLDLVKLASKAEDTSIMFMFAACAVAFISAALLILK